MTGAAPIIGMITNAEYARSGKYVRVQINGERYNCEDHGLMQHVGQTIMFVPRISQQGGRTYRWINDYQLGAQQQSMVPPAQPAPTPQPIPSQAPPMPLPTAQLPQQAPAPKPSVDPHACLPFVSNTVAHAIQAEQITKPDDLVPWAVAAYKIAMRILQGHIHMPSHWPTQDESENPQPQPNPQQPAMQSDEFDDDIPF